MQKFRDQILIFSFSAETLRCLETRASKSCRRADLRLGKNFKNLHRVCTFDCETGKTGIFLSFTFLQNSLRFHMLYGMLSPILSKKKQ